MRSIIGKANVIFWLLYLVALIWCSRNSFDDPSSIFYRKHGAFTQRYSAFRGLEVDSFVKKMDKWEDTNITNDTSLPSPNPNPDQFLCIGVPSISRTSESFLAQAVGSLVDTLTPEERRTVHLVVFLANSQPSSHFAYGQPWLSRLADEVLVYEHDNETTTTPARFPRYRAVPYNVRDGQPRGTGRAENTRLDHSVLVQTCHDRGTPYFALVEDDITASPDWYARLRRGLAEVERRTARPTRRDWAYLRLFYSEILMGWNVEEWPSYLRVILAVYVSAAAVLWLVRRKLRQRLASSAGYSALLSGDVEDGVGAGGSAAAAASSPSQRSLLVFNQLAALAMGLWLPALIALVFLGGRVTMRRVNPLAAMESVGGVREMANYGCCSQGLVLPRWHLDRFLTVLREPPWELTVDQLLEVYADGNALAKWALEPSVLQHVGLKQSSAGPYKTKVWNFSFERRKKVKAWQVA